MWGNLLNQPKIAFFNAIKSEETEKIVKEFTKKDEIFIPKKFKEKITPQDSEEQKKMKANFNPMKLKAQIEILEEKTTHYKTKYHEIDQELITEIKELCHIETQFLKELWGKNWKKEEEKSWTKKIIWQKTYLRKRRGKKKRKKHEQKENEKQKQKITKTNNKPKTQYNDRRCNPQTQTTTFI